jgi:hypothetical protein
MKKESIQTRNRKTNTKTKKSSSKSHELLHPKLEGIHPSQSLALNGNSDLNSTLDFGMNSFFTNGNFLTMPNGYPDLDQCHYQQYNH